MPTTPCVVELAELCNAVYEDAGEARFVLKSSRAAPPSFGGLPVCTPDDVIWSRTSARRNLVGFYAAVFEHRQHGRVLAFRGTDDAWDAVIDDGAIATGGIPPQARPALIVANSLGLGTSAYVTGHSLGGALALIVAAHLGLPAVSFNAPGVADSCLLTAPAAPSFFKTVARCLANPRVVNIRLSGDPVSNSYLTGRQAGKPARTLPTPSTGLDTHKMKNCIQAVRADADYFNPLDL
jgi:hypothetical protein